MATALATFGVFLAALVSRTGMLWLPPIYDELYHILPARSLQETGTFAILDGAYKRAPIFTRFVALAYDLAGERSPAAARFLPSVLPGALLAAVMFLWTRLVAGWIAACVVAVFLLFWPNGIEVSQYIRFYALQGLAFVVAALSIYTATTTAVTVRAQAVLLAAALFLLLFALSLQPMTLIGSAAIAMWIAVLYLPGWLKRHPRLWWVIASVSVLAAIVLARGVLSEDLAHLWTTYRWEPWPVLRDTTFYHRDFRDNYPTFWPLFPLAALIALRARFVPASFCVALFTVSFVLQSFGGLKNIRYLYPTMPFFFAIWGIALAATARTLMRYFLETAEAALAPAVRPALRRGAAVLALAVASLFVVAANAAFERSVRMIDGSTTEFLLGKRRWQWTGVRELVEPWLRRGAVVITTEEMTTVGWLGDYDIAFNKPRFSEMLYVLGPGTRPFALDIRTGRPIVGEVEDLRPVISCAPVGLILSNASWMSTANARASERIAEETGADVVTDIRGDIAMLAWRRDSAPQVECPDLPGLRDPGAAARLLAGESQARYVSSKRAER
jgi:hypothetical protein